MMGCSIESCNKKVVGWGFCEKHYRAYKKYGDPLVNKRKKQLDFEIDSDGCFICTSHSVDGSGYHIVSMNGRYHRAHRLVYEECYGFIPDGLVVRHKCDKPSCINPEHLEIGTKADNNWDKSKRGRCNPVRGSKQHNSKLTEEDVTLIRVLYKRGVARKDLAKKFRMGLSSIHRIVNYESWTHVK